MAYIIAVHFVLMGSAREKIGDEILKIPRTPPSGVPHPSIGDFISIPGLESFALQVVAREFRFQVDRLDVDCYLESRPLKRLGADLKVVK